VFCASLDESNAERAEALRARGAELVALGNEHGKVDLPAMLTELAARGVNELHVEAGYNLNGSLLREGCVDELLIYVAPSLLGTDALGMINLAAPATLDARKHLHFHAVERIGEDLRILARFVRAEDLQADPL
jgi:diaminohydroxyphosphoribosylaminopyrimidine deaminase / 5-amino-6-(5-phosphoribosylamino)uracil reductase